MQRFALPDIMSSARRKRIEMTESETAGKALLDSAIEVYYDDLRKAVRRRGLQQVHATEVVHDLYILLSRDPERLHGKSSLRAFLLRAAVNLGIDRARRAAFESRLFSLMDVQTLTVPAPTVSPGRIIDHGRRVALLKTAIADLPDQCRIVFIAYRIGGMDKGEIAERLGIKRRMVDRHIRNALLSCLARMESLE